MKCLIICSLFVALASAVGQSILQPLYLEPKIPTRPQKPAHDVVGRITGGEPALPGQFPFQAGLRIKIKEQTGFCGGVLISNKAVLTAAHCCEKAEQIEVILGSVFIKANTEPTRISVTVPRENIKVHEYWNMLTLVNDICMLQFPEPIKFNENVQPAKLPINDSQDYAENSVIASGWGKDSDQSTTISPILRFVQSTVLSNRICNIQYLGIIRGTHICFRGWGGKGTCNGDSGGPLVLETDGSTVVGITSFGLALGCERGWPAVFTRVSKYLPWIKDNMN